MCGEIRDEKVGAKNKINEKEQEKREWKLKQITRIEMSECARFCLRECKRNCSGGMKKDVLRRLH
jgi:hypothetical protein